MRMNVELVESAIAGKRLVGTTGPAENVTLIIGSLALKNRAYLSRLVALVLGEEQLGEKILNPDPLDIFLAGIALGRAAGFPA